MTLTGTSTGVASSGSPLTVTATAGTLVCTVAGGPTRVQVEAGSFATSWIDTAGTTVTRPATVDSKPSANVLRDQNCAIWGEVVPTAGGQVGGRLLNSYVDGSNETGLQVGSDTVLTLIKRVAAVSTSLNISYTHAANTPLQYQAFWSDQGMAIRTRSLTAGVWSAWSAWATNANTAPAPIAATYEIGSRAGASQFAGWYPDFRSLFLPTKATLAEYQTHVATDANWGIK